MTADAWPDGFDGVPVAGSAVRQAVRWPLDTWLRLVHINADRHNLNIVQPSLPDALADLHAEPLDRARIYKFAEAEQWRMLWLSTLVWGYGDKQMNRGPASVAKGWVRLNLERRVADVVEAARRGPAAVFQTKRRQPYGMAVPMGSKLWHFAGRGQSGLDPLIYDQNVHLALQSVLGGQWPAPNAMVADDYVRWCTWAASHARDALEPADVELVVFATGRRLRGGE